MFNDLVTVKSVLIIGKTWPEPLTTGAGVRMMQIIDFFTRNDYEINFASAASKSKYSANLEEQKVKTYPIKVNDSGFNEVLKKINPQIVIFDRYHTEEQFSWRVDEVFPSVLKILDSEDLHFLRQARGNLIKKNKFPYSHNDVFKESLSLKETYRELNAMYRCDLTLVISKFEIDFLENSYNFPKKNLIHFPMLPKKSYDGSLSFEERKDFVFIGNFNHKPNVDAVLELKKVFPNIKNGCKDSELHIYGAYMPENIANLHNPKNGIYIKGWVENLTETLVKYRLMLAPLRFGAGIKCKILESLNVKTPVISTEIGFEGICENENAPGYSGPVNKIWIEEAIKLYNDKNSWEEKSKLSNLALQNLKWDEISTIHRIEHFKKNLFENRELNITQNMLSLSNNQTYKYLSKYIELKNKKG